MSEPLDLAFIEADNKRLTELNDGTVQPDSVLAYLLNRERQLLTEVSRLRGEVNTMAHVDYMIEMDEVGRITRDFEPPYPNEWNGQ